MTERLNQLLRDEADRLSVPPVAADAALGRGRTLRRRRSVAMAGATGVVLAVVAGTAWIAVGGDGDRAVEPAGAPSSDGLAFAIGNDVYVDGGDTRARIDDNSVKSLYYTSAGVLVRQGDNPNSDGGGPQRFSLVTPDGTVQPISVVTEGTVHATDATQPYLAYAERTGASYEVVVWNVETDTEAARVALPADAQSNVWDAPPVSLSGDLVYVGTTDVARTVNWSTGEVAETNAIAPGYPQVFGGRAAEDNRVVDATTGETLLQVEGQDIYITLSPDGRFARVESYDGDLPTTVYDIAAKSSVALDNAPRGYGWSPDGQLFTVDGHELTTCSPTTGACETSDVDLVKEPVDSQGEMQICTPGGGCEPAGPPPDYTGELKLGGLVYES